MYELVIIGAGPGGTAAAVYASRKKIRTALITKEFGGQSVVSPDIQNWIGDIAISGDELAKKFEAHVRAYADDCAVIEEGTCVTHVEKTTNGFSVATENGKTFDTKTVLITTGGQRRKLTVPGALEFDQKGLTYCASCDGPLFSGMDVVVIGGGNAGFETAAQLLAYTKSVTLLHRSAKFNADEVTVEKVLAHKNMTGILNADITEVVGDKFVQGIKYKDVTTGEEKELAVNGVFVEIGMVPGTDFLGDLVTLDKYKKVVVDHKTQQTSQEGVWAAGDCTDSLYHQNNIAAGDAIKALEDIYLFLNTK